eukprot:TRINITY_DN26260_c0_g1_i1.p1 TRINITY_DN26260_c0_g1~~TRINITY_DN26260_c0_g1_i1.p1  ORF type:complete len:235 (+),score=75.91 TRINITY_DN26260_c0_g1_i1:92-796(+)
MEFCIVVKCLATSMAENDMEEADCVFKLIVLGAPGAGKTSIIQRYCAGTFNPRTKTTMGIDYWRSRVTRKSAAVDFKIWDTVGQDTYSSLTRMYYKGVHGALLVYDIANADSFAKVKYWLNDLKDNGSGLERVVMVGNKVDVETDREVTALEGSTFASQRKVKWLECSAKTGQGVTEAFKELMEEVFEAYENDEKFAEIGRNSTMIANNNKGFDLNGRSAILKNKKTKVPKNCC